MFIREYISCLASKKLYTQNVKQESKTIILYSTVIVTSSETKCNTTNKNMTLKVYSRGWQLEIGCEVHILSSRTVTVPLCELLSCCIIL